jgi:hypothetical protein
MMGKMIGSSQRADLEKDCRFPRSQIELTNPVALTSSQGINVDVARSTLIAD